uniref:Uncharacterized protein n=1 Tax=viral metagenome TaxID=1070528 RepID=A0A6C0LZM2_9ZZZZ
MSEHRERLRDLWGSFVFRRVKRVIPNSKTAKCHIIHSGIKRDDTITIDPSKSIAPYGKRFCDRYITSHYSSYYGFTRSRRLDSPMHTNAQCDPNGHEIYFNKRDYNSLDMSNDITCRMSIKPQDFHKRDIVPLEGALVCGIVEEVNGKYQYTKWWVCSEQFYWLWLIIMYDEHPTIGDDLQERIDRLVTNTFMLWNDANMDASLNEKRLMFVYNRAEQCSFYPYLYKVIAMHVRGREYDLSDYAAYVPYGMQFIPRLTQALDEYVHSLQPQSELRDDKPQSTSELRDDKPQSTSELRDDKPQSSLWGDE